MSDPLFRPMDSEEKYLLADYKRRSQDGGVLWWGPNWSGYYSDLALAGLYTKEEAKEIEADSFGETVAIPESALVNCRRRIVIDMGDTANAWLRSVESVRQRLSEQNTVLHGQEKTDAGD